MVIGVFEGYYIFKIYFDGKRLVFQRETSTLPIKTLEEAVKLAMGYATYAYVDEFYDVVDAKDQKKVLYRFQGKKPAKQIFGGKIGWHRNPTPEEVDAIYGHGSIPRDIFSRMHAKKRTTKAKRNDIASNVIRAMGG